MSYDPPAQPPGGGTPQGESGGYTPPPAGGGYTPPPAGGSYTPPPAGGSYTPPPAPGNYTPPPTGGGYGAPPPAPPAGGGQFDFQGLLQSWINAITKPNAGTYENEIPRANWVSVLVGVALVTLVSIIMGLIGGAAAAESTEALREQLGGRDLPFDPGMVSTGSGFGAIIFTPLFFFIGSGILYMLAKMFGGQGNDFMTHSYLLSLSYAPLGVLAALVGIIPGVGALLGLVILVYRQFSQGAAIQAYHRLASGRAQLTAFLPLIVMFALVCICALLAVFGLAAALGGANR